MAVPQQQFLPLTPVARRDDPVTSKQAAREVTRDGTRTRQANEVYVLVVRYPGMTAREYDKIAGFTREVSHKRLPELEKEKNGALIKRGFSRTCSLSGKKAITWWPKSWVFEEEAVERASDEQRT